jgi:hypothetical protein
MTVTSIENPLAELGTVLAEVSAGRPVVVIRSERDLGSLVIAADRVNAASMAFLVRHSSGYVCVTLTAEVAQRLELKTTTCAREGREEEAHLVAVDAAYGIGTGISARAAPTLPGCSPTRTHWPLICIVRVIWSPYASGRDYPASRSRRTGHRTRVPGSDQCRRRVPSSSVNRIRGTWPTRLNCAGSPSNTG